MNPAWLPLWIQDLCDIAVELLEPAFLKLERTFKPTAASPFPAPAHLRELLETARSISADDEAETAWHGLLGAVQRCYHPDLGWRGPKLAERIDHAARAANGVHYLSQCSEDDLVWAKKRFVECFPRDRELAECDGLLPAKEILRPLTSDHEDPHGPPRSLPEAEAEPTYAPMKDSSPRCDSRPWPEPVLLSDKQLDDWKREQKAKLEKWQRDHTNVRAASQ